jgi:glutamate 5-kinase
VAELPASRGSLVVKLGSSSITTGAGPDPVIAAETVAACATAITQGWGTVLVSSGAAALGQLELDRRGATGLAQHRQVAAALGQPELMSTYGFIGRTVDVSTCQVLVSEADLLSQDLVAALGSLLRSCFAVGVLPVVNGNDPTDTARSNNDVIALAIAVACQADHLIYLSDVDGVLDAPPPDGKVIPDLSLDALRRVPDLGTSAVGTGGMAQKLAAARLAAYNGIETTISRVGVPSAVRDIVDGRPVGTRVHAVAEAQPEPDRWLAGIAPSAGAVTINLEAENSIRAGQSLFGSGIKKVRGSFGAGAVVDIEDHRRNLVGRGRVRASSDLLNLVRGLTAREAATVYLTVLDVWRRKEHDPQSSEGPAAAISDREGFRRALELVASNSAEQLRRMSIEIANMVPEILVDAAMYQGTESLAAEIEASTGRLSLVNNAQLVIFEVVSPD